MQLTVFAFYNQIWQVRILPTTTTSLFTKLKQEWCFSQCPYVDYIFIGNYVKLALLNTDSYVVVVGGLI